MEVVLPALLYRLCNPRLDLTSMQLSPLQRLLSSRRLRRSPRPQHMAEHGVTPVPRAREKSLTRAETCRASRARGTNSQEGELLTHCNPLVDLSVSTWARYLAAEGGWSREPAVELG